ncbi:E1 ubiquitin-activating protein aos1 [Diplodia intermedia]|uniref:Ubiquitin-like 1-activating enzyme E1A n=1 Tax=Diplodia intermedia TaxID=856260 RepID=A0ABR3TQ62_9PEZI
MATGTSATLPMHNGALPADDPAGEVVASIAQAQTISPDEIALYDRQIRLWGVQAQERLRSANVLLITVKALANEVAKNLVLAGIKSLTILDHEPVTEDDLGSQFFISEADVGQNVQRLNPRVEIVADNSDIRTKVPDFYQPFDLVIATDLDFTTLSTVDASTRLAQKPFYAAGTQGMYGYIFADLIQHEYVIEREKSNVATTLRQESTTRSLIAFSDKGTENGKRVELVTKREMYSPLLLANTSPLPPEYQGNRRKLRQVTPLLTCFRALWEFQKVNGRSPSHIPADLQLFTTLATEKHKELQLPIETLTSEFLRKFLQDLGSELAPVTAFIGGQLAQDVINVIGRREQPIQNLMLFDGDESKAPVYAMHPIFTT